MTPDTPTLFIVGALICGLAAMLQWLVARRRYAPAPALMVWAAANLVFGLGSLAHAMRPLISFPASVLIGNGLLIFGTGLLLVGLDIFDSHRPRLIELFAGPVIAVIALALALYSSSSANELAFIVSLPVAYYLIRTALRLPQLLNVGATGVRTTCSLIMLTFAVCYLVRGAVVYAGLLPPTDASSILIGGLVRILALIVAVAWSVCSLVMILDREASLDPLTGLLNRRAWLAAGSRLMAEARMKNRNLAILALDIDRFKQVNDRHGHHAGDDVLRVLAQLATQTVRDSDVIGRLGGEEFCLVLPGADEPQAYQIAERLRALCEQSLGPSAGLPGPVTVSVGIATLSAADLDFATLLKHADTALYQAKGQGRNRVVGSASTSPT